MKHQINPFGQKTPYDQGYLAFVAVGTNASNPHPYGSDAWNQWICGYNDALEESKGEN